MNPHDSDTEHRPDSECPSPGAERVDEPDAAQIGAGYDAVQHEADLRRMAPIDLGDGLHAAGWTSWGDLWWMHRCDGPNYRGDQPWRWAIARLDVTSGEKHELRKRLPIYVGGSILCVDCGDHGFINDGKWVKA